MLADLGPTDVVRRDVGTEPAAGDGLGPPPSPASPPRPTAATSSAPAALAAGLADEVVSADALIFAVPLYNFGVSQHFKTWYDVVSTDPRMGPGTTSLAGRPAFLVTARGGGYGAGTPREGWDHATGWMRRVLEDVWGLDLDVIETELTLAEVTPQMADLRELAHALLAESHETALQRGRSLRLRLRSAA